MGRPRAGRGPAPWQKRAEAIRAEGVHVLDCGGVLWFGFRSIQNCLERGRLRLPLCSDHVSPLFLQGIPPSLRPAVWSQISGANDKKAKHQPNHYTRMITLGEGSRFRRQIDLASSCARIPGKAGSRGCDALCSTIPRHLTVATCKAQLLRVSPSPTL